MVKHSFSFKTMKPQLVHPNGSRIRVTAQELPVLHNISLAVVKIAPGCAREPHWHPNASEMTYCLKGKALITVFSPKNEHNTFTLDPGEVFYIPKGYIHHIANISQEEAEFIIAFSHHSPEDVELADSINCMPAYVFADTFGVPPSFFEKIQTKKNAFFTPRPVAEKPTQPYIANHFKLNVEKLSPQVLATGGSAKIANIHTLPMLEDLALFSIRINEKGVREPHWHPNAGELNYVVTGKARLIVLSPGGDIDTYEIGPGEGSFIPASYFHYIESISNEELHMTIFFSNPAPSDLGISGALSAYSNELLSSLFEVPVDYFKGLPRFQEDVMIVPGKK